MTFTLSIWAIPCIATLAIWLIAGAWPLPRRSGDYDFTQGVHALFHLIVAVIATLLVWLFFFALT